MHIVLTDVLACPRCGPEFGLVLLADRVEARRVIAGVLGCSNCREKYPIERGVARFDGAGPLAQAGQPTQADQPTQAGPLTQAGQPTQPAARVDAPSASESADAAATALRLGALLGVTHGPGFLLLAGPAAAHAAELATLIEDIEVIAVHDTIHERQREAGVSRVVLPAGASRLPFATGKVAGIALTGLTAAALLEEAVRSLSPVARLVLEPAPADAEQRLAALRLRVLARDDAAIVAARF